MWLLLFCVKIGLLLGLDLKLYPAEAGLEGTPWDVKGFFRLNLGVLCLNAAKGV